MKRYADILKTCVVAGFCCAASAAWAVDIPMDSKLAAGRLEAKTCYATLKNKGKLVGYELNGDLLVSSAGRLVAVPSSSSHDVGDGKPRRYQGGGLDVEIKPLSDEKTETIKNITYTIKERAVAILIENGKRRRFRLDVLFNCS
ncbi:hypothetical protein Jab_1c23910 [Janthinobacterium sp. HH01]|uniref:hypothetical protein n=1 Tax=Janthinobacterium sp. HH01 TaxID=1198452 RepID=UPI0002AEB788|nr:hypothetical protein [Janthinobacterium sp. HH01]ELX13753.1 hypothetical protein Jab_1c23910 [Janthinobacterium sp. HH01]